MSREVKQSCHTCNWVWCHQIFWIMTMSLTCFLSKNRFWKRSELWIPKFVNNVLHWHRRRHIWRNNRDVKSVTKSLSLFILGMVWFLQWAFTCYVISNRRKGVAKWWKLVFVLCKKNSSTLENHYGDGGKGQNSGNSDDVICERCHVKPFTTK